MSFFGDIEAAIKAEIPKMEAAIKSLAAFFKPLIVAGAEEVAQAALQSVLQQAPLVISGAEKLNAATANVITTLGSAGKTAATELVTAAVQTAYSAISASLAPPAPTPVAQ